MNSFSSACYVIPYKIAVVQPYLEWVWDSYIMEHSRSRGVTCSVQLCCLGKEEKVRTCPRQLLWDPMILHKVHTWFVL
jgi:hypothetical protein